MDAPWRVLATSACGTALGVLAALLIHDRLKASSPSRKRPRSETEEILQATSGGDRTVNAFGTGTDSTEESLDREQLSRIISFFGEDDFAKISDAFVIVVGLGGVGSHAAHLLARSGVGRLRLVDFDNVTLSSLNRHALATRADVGIPKVVSMEERLAEIVPGCAVEACACMFDEEAAEELLEGSPTYVLDCIDDVRTKCALLAACHRRGLKVITATGAGAKADPTSLCIGSLKDAVRDPLASKIRWSLRKSGVPSKHISCVYSDEKASRELLPLEEDQEEDPSAFGNLEQFRVRVIPVLGTMPAMMGMAMASFVLTNIAGQPFEPAPTARLGRDLRNKLFTRLVLREKQIYNSENDLDLDKDDIDFIVRYLYRQRSPFSEKRMGARDRFVLTRWDPQKPAGMSNIVLLTQAEADKLVAKGRNAFGEEAAEKIDRILAEVQWD